MKSRLNILKLSAFIVLSFFSTIGFGQTCDDFKTGKFYCYAEDSTMFQVVRKKNKQIETAEGIEGSIILEVEWTSDCRYKLKYLKSTKEFKEKYHDFYSSVDYLICDILDPKEDSYRVTARLKGTYDKQEMILYRVKD